MLKIKQVLTFAKKSLFVLSSCFFLLNCSDDQILDDAAEASGDAVTSAAATTCNCTYTVPANKNLIDGKTLNLKPGAVICLNAATKYGNLHFQNIVGTSSAPIIIKNCGGTATVEAGDLAYGIKFSNSKYFRITGGNTSGSYGIKIHEGHLGLTLEALSTYFEVDHIEVSNVGFAGVMAKTDPTCDDATIRGNFTMMNVSIHDNYVHDTGGEGFYVGNSFYQSGRNTSCGVRYPHEIHNLKLYNNIVKNSGWEGIQVGCATSGTKIYGNKVENYGVANNTAQNNGMQIGEGTGGLFYQNFIKNGPGNGLIVLGLGDNLVHDNVIANAGGSGIFCDDRVTKGNGFKFLNNTIVSPKQDGIRIYADAAGLTNVIVNNIIVNPGSYGSYSYPRSSSDAYIYKLSSKVITQISNNYQTKSISTLKFTNEQAFNYRLTSSSPVINKGKNVSSYGIPKDFYQQTRLKGTNYDIGASEY